MILGDFNSTLGLVRMWRSPEEVEQAKVKGKTLGIIFSIFCLFLLVSIVMTIITPPGYIPEEEEWDMPIDNDEEFIKPKKKKKQKKEDSPRNDAEPRDSALSDFIEQQNKSATGTLARYGESQE